MHQPLDEGIARLREVPDADQERVAEDVLRVIGDGPPAFRLSPEQIAEVERRLRGLEDGSIEYASEEDVAAFWSSCGL